jgi:hypothetical protein
MHQQDSSYKFQVTCIGWLHGSEHRFVEVKCALGQTIIVKLWISQKKEKKKI